MKKLRVVQIGTGHDHAPSPIDSMKRRDDVELLGFVRVEDEKRTFDGVPELKYEDVLQRDDIDAVFIETEDKYLTKYAQAFVDKGIPVQMDKPGGQDKESFDRLFDSAKEKHVPLHLGYMYRYNPAIKELFRKVESGELGKIRYVEAQMNCWHGLEKRKWLRDYTGGMMNYLGCHLIDLVFRLQGKPDRIVPFNAATDKNSGEDISFAVFLYDGKPSFIKSTAVEAGGFMRRQIVVCGEKGTVELNPTEYYEDGVMKTDEYFAQSDAAWGYRAQKRVFSTPDRYDDMFDEFLKIVRGETENPYSYEYEKQLHDLVLTACGIENKKDGEDKQ